MEHIGTKYEHSSTSIPINNRGQFNYCSLCNGWFPRQDMPDINDSLDTDPSVFFEKD